MKKLLYLIPVAIFATLLFTGQVFDNGSKNLKNTVDGSYIWNIHKVQMWYEQRGLTPPASIPLARPQISTLLSVMGIDQTDVHVYTSTNPQSENSIGINPVNSNNLMISTNGYSTQPWFFTTNGGSSWSGSEADPNGISNYGDPVAFFNTSGKAFWCTLLYPGGIGFASTTNNGATWTTLANGDPSASTNDDKQHATCDKSGTYPNNVYTAWTDFTTSPYPLYINRSTNDGVTWGTKINISLPNPHFNHGVTLATGPNGEVYVAWADYATGSLPETGMGFTKSTNGGVSYSASSTIFTMSGIRATNVGIATYGNTRVNSFPKMDVDMSTGPRRGWIYIVYPDQNTGDADVYLRRSTNGGTTWSSAIRVNNDVVGNGKPQWMPSVAVDKSNGALAVSYYNMDTTVTYSTARYTATSLDGGDTWNRTRVSDVRWTMAPISGFAGGYCGDYYETAAGGGNIWACWSDNRTGYWQAYTSKLTLVYNLSLTALLSGNYNGTTMVPKNVRVELHNSTTPYALVDSQTVQLNSSGAANPVFTKAAGGTSYYIVIKSNNGLETWSATPQTFSGTTLSYDFTTAASKAYGSNMILVGTKWCIISGDANQDGAIDALDRSQCWNDRNLSGVYASDLNGDGTVDALDRSIAWNNRNLAVAKPALLTSLEVKRIKR